MYIFGDLFTCVIWFNCHTLIINKHLNTRCLQFFSHFQIHQHIPIFLFSPIMTFGASCRCLCSFHLGFVPTPSFRSPPPPDSRLFLMGPFWSLLNIMSLFSMLFPFLVSLLFSFAILSPSVSFTFSHSSEAGPTRVLLSEGHSFSLLFYASFLLQSSSLPFFAFPLLYKYILYFYPHPLSEAPLTTTLSVTVLGSVPVSLVYL